MNWSHGWIVLLALTLQASPAWSMSDPACAKSLIELRKGPGPKFPVSWKVARFMPFLKVDSKGQWIKVQDLEGEVHWARRQDLTSQFSCVVVKTAVARLRQEPSTSSPSAELATLDRYTPLKRLASRAEWMEVQDQVGRKAWIHESQVWRPVKIQSFDF